MSVALNPRRWFRFRLRTVLLLIALLAIPCAWIGSEWKLVHDRAALIDRVEAAGGEVWDLSGPPLTVFGQPKIVIEPGVHPTPIPTMRQWFGDRSVRQIRIPIGFSDDYEKRILDLFPDTLIVERCPPIRKIVKRS